MKIDLGGKVAVVTGSSRGLGEAIARTFAGAGAAVALVARDSARLTKVRDSIRASGGSAELFAADLTVEAHVTRIVSEIEAKFGAVHILVNNAGTILRASIDDTTPDEFIAVIESSLLSTLLMSRALVPGMRTNGYGRIINLSSTMGHVALAGRTAYASAKAGILGFTRSLALEIAPNGITVNSISPGPIASDMTKAIADDPVANAKFLANLPVRRWGTADEIGALACFLASDYAGFITGADILIDGGWTAQ